MKKNMVVALLCIAMMFGMVSCKDDRDIVPTVEPPKVSNIDDGVASVQCDSIIWLSIPVEGARLYYSLDEASYKEYEHKTGIALSEIKGLSNSISLSFYAEKDGMNRSDVVKKVYGVVHSLEACYAWEETSDGYVCTASMKCPVHGNVVGEVERVTSISKTVVKESSCTENGTTRYKCVFTGKGYEDQTKDVDDVPKVPHVYDAEVAEDRYLKSAATCTDKAVYFKSCSMCGGKSSDATFECGEALGHGYSSGYSYDEEFHWMTCNRCGVDSKGSGIIPNDRHVYDSDVAEDRYLKSKATYTDRAVYYKSCSVCGASSNSDDYTFEYGETLVSETILDNIVIRIEDGTGTVICVVDSKRTNWECAIPEKVDGICITGISPNAFSGCRGLTSVTIPDSVTSIGKEAFDGCNNLSEIHAESFTKDEWRSMSKDSSIPSKATVYLKDGARDGKVVDGGITYLVNGDGTRYVSDADESITTAVIPSVVEGDPVTYIGWTAFGDCRGLTNVTIPGSVTAIGNWAFTGCYNLSEIHAASFTKDVWRSMSKYASVPLKATVYLKDGARDGRIVEGGITYLVNGDGTRYVSDADESITTAVIPREVEGDSVTSIYDCAFEGCTSLTSVAIGDFVTIIGSCAFWRCTSLTSVTIPDSVTSIGGSAFEGCIGLASVTIPDSVTFIGGEAFKYCDLTSVTIPDSVTSIEGGAFEGCTSLTSVTIGDSVTSIGESAFEGCTSLTSVTIGDSVTTIKSDAFRRCTSLTSVTIPDSVTSIGSGAFYGCTSLTNVTIGDSVATIRWNAFEGCISLTSITIPNSVTSIENYTFSSCTSLTSVVIPDSVTYIGRSAFSGCTSLTSVTIPDSVTYIGGGAFSYCVNLTILIDRPKDSISGAPWGAPNATVKWKGEF